MLAITYALAEKYGRFRLTLSEVATELGIAEQTLRNRMSRGEFKWIYSDGGRLRFADARDVAQYLDSARPKKEQAA